MSQLKVLYEFQPSAANAKEYGFYETFRVVEFQERTLPRPLRISCHALHDGQWNKRVGPGPVILHLLEKLQEAQAAVKRLREVELLAKDYRRAWKAFQTVPALHEETGSIAWAEVDKAYGAATAALEELLAVLGKEAAE